MKQSFNNESKVDRSLERLDDNIVWNKDRKQQLRYSIETEIRKGDHYYKAKKKLVHLVSLALFVTILFIGYQSTVPYINNPIVDESDEFITSTEEEEIDSETRKLIQGLEAAQEQVSFEIILPELNLIPSSIREESSIEVKNYRVDLKGVRTTFGKGRKYIKIIQTFDTGRPPDIKGLELVDITGAEAYLKIAEFGGPNRIYLWEDGQYFNISALEVLSVEELVAIARSIASIK
ncbi:hypothetical protein RJD24_08045 [Bacillaceae bacterium IKA-2]|nr:hypothetical protein RJD24_08045 [Bacillaceae bacterium IKA-2]